MKRQRARGLIKNEILTAAADPNFHNNMCAQFKKSKFELQPPRSKKPLVPPSLSIYTLYFLRKLAQFVAAGHKKPRKKQIKIAG